jgi:hypothetical protein
MSSIFLRRAFCAQPCSGERTLAACWFRHSAETIFKELANATHAFPIIRAAYGLGGGVGRGLGVVWDRGVGEGLGVAVGLPEAVAVAVGVGLGVDAW